VIKREVKQRCLKVCLNEAHKRACKVICTHDIKEIMTQRIWIWRGIDLGCRKKVNQIKKIADNRLEKLRYIRRCVFDKVLKKREIKCHMDYKNNKQKVIHCVLKNKEEHVKIPKVQTAFNAIVTPIV